MFCYDLAGYSEVLFLNLQESNWILYIYIRDNTDIWLWQQEHIIKFSVEHEELTAVSAGQVSPLKWKFIFQLDDKSMMIDMGW